MYADRRKSMGTGESQFIIERIYWERIFLNFEIFADCPGEPEFYLEGPGGRKAGLEAVKGKDSFIISLNMACAFEGSFLENGRWRLMAKSGGGDSAEAKVCAITANAAYKLDDLSRIFKYAEDQMAYNVSFGVVSEDEKSLEFYMDSYFMTENRRWKRRRYVKEVRRPKEKVKRFFMYGAVVLIRIYYHVLYAFIPKKGNRIMFMSETKDFLWGNLKYIDARIKERGLDSRFTLTYSYRSAAGKHQGLRDIPGWIKVVTKIAAQDYIFIDDYAPVLGFFNLGKKTKLIQVWHAGEGFKSVGYSRFGKEGSPFPEGSCHRKYTHVITASERLIKVFQEVFPLDREAFYPVGMPRLDGFLDRKNIESFKEGFFRDYEYLKGRKLILFAPTYRGSEQKEAYYDYSMIDLKRIYDFCRKEGYAFLVKMHPFVKKKMEIPEEYGDTIYDFSQYPNINDLYYVTDILITDYSSNYFEYALMRRPVIFFTYDRRIYELTRGVHRSIKATAPGKVCDTFDQLMECLEKKDFETEKIIRFADENFSDYRGNASDKVIDEILLKGEALSE